MRKQLCNIHHFLAQHSFYALAISSALACGIVAARVRQTHTLVYIFMIWNLFLAWVPYLWSLWAATIQRRAPRAWWRLLLPGALWLLFFPNALYIVTDLIHLRERPPVPLWFDMGLLAAFAWCGCFLGVASLHTMQMLVRRVAGALASWLFVVAAIGLSGLGVYLGRFLRWNSWDLFLRPQDVLADALGPILHPRSNIFPIGASGMYAALLLMCYVMFVAAYHGGRHGAQAGEEI